MAIDRDKVILAAQKYAEKKRYDKAIIEYQRLVAEDPNDARTLLKIGDLHLKLAAYPDAIATYERVGRFYSSQGFSLKAIAVYKQIREIVQKHVPELDERYAHVVPILADLYQALGLTSDALAALDEHAIRLQKAGRDEDATAIFRKIVELDPINPLPHLRLAEALSRRKESDGAATEFGMAAAQLLKHGRRDEALKVLERLLQHRPDPVQARIAAELYLARGRDKDGLLALSRLQLCFQANSKDLEILGLLARAFRAIGQAPKALEVRKEMARIARDQGKSQVFEEIVLDLVRTAPDDEGVQQLAEGLDVHAADVGDAPPSVPPDATNAGTARAHGHAQGAGFAASPPREDPHEDAGDLPPTRVDVATAAATARARRSEPAAGDAAQENLTLGRIRAAAIRDSGRAQAVEEIEEIDAELEEDGEPEELQPVDAEDQLQELLREADAFRTRRAYDRAAETLQAAVELDPRNIDVRLVLHEVLLEASRPLDAVEELLAVASLELEALDGDAAVRTLERVLGLEPTNERAILTLRELGFEVDDTPGASVDDRRGEDPADPNAPLPAFELEEVGSPDDTGGSEVVDLSPYLAAEPVPLMPRGSKGESQKPHLRSSHPKIAKAKKTETLDDPFAPNDERLPSFPLDSSSYPHLPPERAAQAKSALSASSPKGSPTKSPSAPTARSHAPAASPASTSASPGPPRTAAAAREKAPERVPAEAPGRQIESPPQSVPAVPRQGTDPGVTARRSAEIEDALEEADFYATRGLFDDARAVLREQVARSPNHPLLRERLTELEAQQVAAQSSGTRAVPRDAGDDRAFDIAASLDAMETIGAPQIDPHFAGANQQVDVEEVFAKFKEGVAKQLSIDDGPAHYDLGVAYKEMGLFDDAVRELSTASKEPKLTCVCESIVGAIYFERGELDHAVEAFSRGLAAPIRTYEQETALNFELASVFETKQDFREALTYYQRVVRRDPGHRDVEQRIHEIESALAGSSRTGRRAASGDSDFDRAFDEMLGGEK